ncbi:Fe-S cluster assembly protein SufD, partial [Haematococcus lacustris]
HDVVVQQGGPRTQTHMNHFVLASSNQLHDLHTKLELNHPEGVAKQLHKCIVASASGRGVFDGNVKVNRRAQRSDAGQLSRNLLLANRATVNVKPNLQIIADDVKCTHGCAVSDLSDEELFYFSFPCQNDDSDGQDARICSLPEFYGGNVPDDSICGAGSTPFNLGQASISTVVDGQSLTVGNMYQSMDLSGVWRGTVQLTCPFMMRLDLGQGYNIQLQVSNSDGRSWRSWTNSSSYGRPYRTCTSWSIPMETSLPCKPNNITLTASLFVVETTALGNPVSQ